MTRPIVTTFFLFFFLGVAPVKAEWLDLGATVYRNFSKCIYNAQVYAMARTNYGSACASIKPNIDFETKHRCHNKIWPWQEDTFLVAVKSPARNPVEGTDLRVDGFISGSPEVTFPQIDLYAIETVSCRDCEKPKVVKADPNDCDPSSPIIIDFSQDGFQFAPPTQAVSFWMFPAAPYRQVLNWVAAGTNDGFLALDQNDNFQIDNGNELFGDGTLLVLKDLYAASGYAAMAQYDLKELGGNEDGRLSDQDAVWSELLIWVDADANGLSKPSELSFAQEKLRSINIIPTPSDYVDNFGNEWRLSSDAEGSDGFTLNVLDVYFDRHPDQEPIHLKPHN